TKPVGLGTGLGLSIAYSIVAKHAGTLLAEDAPEGGTRMSIVLPHQSALEGDAEASRAPQAGLSMSR
ncbi:MAG TPA: ATP-binding protein, partial [Polyangiaceae bacterium]|nr:ATP-binding protein [Polyangiaceae bacterium]